MKLSRLLPTPERVTFVAAVAVLVGVAGGIVLLWVQPRDEATLRVEQTGEVRVVDGQSYLTATVSNTGDVTAEAVQVVAELLVDGEVITSGEQVVDFLSGGEAEEVVFVLDGSAPEAETKLRVASHKDP